MVTRVSFPSFHSSERMWIDAAARARTAIASGGAQQILDEEKCVVAIAEAGPEVDLPTQRPTGAVVATDLERLAGGGEKLRSGRRDLATRIDPKEVRGVAVMDVLLHEVFKPLLELATRADLERTEFRLGGFNSNNERGIGAEDFAGFDAVREEIPEDRHVHGGGHADAAALTIGCNETDFRRAGRGSDEVALAIIDEPIKAKLGGTFHDRPGTLAQKFPIAGESIVFPQMLTEPRADHRPFRPHRIAAAEVPDGSRLAPDVGIVMRHPAVRTVVDRRSLAAVDRKFFNLGEKRLMTFG